MESVRTSATGRMAAGVPASVDAKTPLRATRIPNNQIDLILRRLHQDTGHLERAAEHDGWSARPFVTRNVRIDILQPGGTSDAFLVDTYALSENGLAFVHGNFMHRGTQCRVRLRTSSGGVTEVNGEVVRCEYVERGLHRIGMRFASPMDISTIEIDACLRPGHEAMPPRHDA